MIYYGDEIGTLNDNAYRDDPHKISDSRWVHRPTIDWKKAQLRNIPGTVEFSIFTALKRMIAVRKEIEVFSDFNNRELIEVENPQLFVFCRYDLLKPSERVLVVANFDGKPQHFNMDEVDNWGSSSNRNLIDLYSGRKPDFFKNTLVIPSFGFYWLGEI